MKKAIVSAAICFAVQTLIALPAWSADEPKKMNILDFLVDANDLVGKTVTVTGCKFKGASTTLIRCSGGSQGGVAVDSASLVDKEDLRRALKTCADLISSAPGCEGSVTGTVNKGAILELTKAKIIWAQ